MAVVSVEAGIRRALLLGLGRWVVAADAAVWPFGLPIILLALAAGVRLGLSPASPTFHGFPRFLGFFLWQSVRGGLDVARRALHPRMPPAPALVDFPLCLTEPGAQVFFTNTVSLLPGTLSADLAGRRSRVHVFDRRLAVAESLRTVEARVTALFGLSLDPPESPPREIIGLARLSTNLNFYLQMSEGKSLKRILANTAKPLIYWGEIESIRFKLILG